MLQDEFTLQVYDCEILTFVLRSFSCEVENAHSHAVRQPITVDQQ